MLACSVTLITLCLFTFTSCVIIPTYEKTSMSLDASLIFKVKLPLMSVTVPVPVRPFTVTLLPITSYPSLSTTFPVTIRLCAYADTHVKVVRNSNNFLKLYINKSKVLIKNINVSKFNENYEKKYKYYLFFLLIYIIIILNLFPNYHFCLKYNNHTLML